MVRLVLVWFGLVWFGLVWFSFGATEPVFVAIKLPLNHEQMFRVFVVFDYISLLSYSVLSG